MSQVPGPPASVTALIPKSKLDAQSRHFALPAWGGKPDPGWHLDVQKVGTSLGRQDVDQHPYYLFGRDVQVADFTLEHPSASRVHAALVHHHSGSKFIIDLTTKYGTQVNGARINSMEPVRLTVGDRIKFAESSREYVLKCDGLPVPIPARPANVSALLPETPAAPLREVPTPQAPLSTPPTTAFRTRKRVEPTPEVDGQQPTKRPRALVGNTSGNVVECSHIVLKYNACKQPVDRHKLPVTRTKAVALAQIVGYRQELLEIKDVDEREQRLKQLAKQHSDCSKTYTAGGFMGPVRRDDLQEDFERVAFSLQPGELSEPLETSMGIHLIMRHS